LQDEEALGFTSACLRTVAWAVAGTDQGRAVGTELLAAVEAAVASEVASVEGEVVGIEDMVDPGIHTAVP
jgi:hypothetical protein